MKPEARCQAIELILSDVDGVLTDGGIVFDNQGIETKQFHIRDGMGIKLWQRAGYEFGIITTRTSEVVRARAAELGMEDYTYSDNPVVFWDLYGEQGHPIRTTVSEMGPLLLARLLGLNDTQGGVLDIVFRLADEQGLLLLDLEDLQAMLAHAAENAKDLSARYGNVTRASVGTIQRQLLSFDSQGAAHFFGEPALGSASLLTFPVTSIRGFGLITAKKVLYIANVDESRRSQSCP